MKKTLIALFLTSSVFATTAYAKDFTGSIKLSIFKDEVYAADKAKVSVEEAVKIAREATNSTKVMRAELERSYGYLVWEVAVLGKNKTMHQLVIDPVTGKVLYQESWRK